MPRMQLIEIEDAPWCPAPVRDGITDILGFMGMMAEKPLARFADHLAKAMSSIGETHIVDLCSGGGGPAVPLAKLLRARGVDATVRFTDLYPNPRRLAHVCETAGEGFGFEPGSVDATAVPSQLKGFRLMCNSFHHFPPPVAAAILADAVRQRQGIAVMEVVSRTPGGMIPVLFSPLSVSLMVPFIRPFRWDRMALTYLLPVLQFVTLWDGIVSCLRVYDPDELQGLVDRLPSLGVDPSTFDWTIGRVPSGTPAAVTALIGTPKPTD